MLLLMAVDLKENQNNEIMMATSGYTVAYVTFSKLKKLWLKANDNMLPKN